MLPLKISSLAAEGNGGSQAMDDGGMPQYGIPLRHQPVQSPSSSRQMSSQIAVADDKHGFPIGCENKVTLLEQQAKVANVLAQHSLVTASKWLPRVHSSHHGFCSRLDIRYFGGFLRADVCGTKHPQTTDAVSHPDERELVTAKVINCLQVRRRSDDEVNVPIGQWQITRISVSDARGRLRFSLCAERSCLDNVLNGTREMLESAMRCFVEAAVWSAVGTSLASNAPASFVMMPRASTPEQIPPAFMAHPSDACGERRQLLAIVGVEPVANKPLHFAIRSVRERALGTEPRRTPLGSL
jgi:hypothetical protein